MLAALAACLALAAPLDLEPPAIWPLVDGARWEFRFTVDGRPLSVAGEPLPAIFEVTGAEVLASGEVVHELRVRRGSGLEYYEYWSADERGVRRWHNDLLGGARGLQPGRAPRLILSAAAAAGEVREWDEVWWVQTMAGAAGPSDEELTVHHRAEVLAVDEPVAVPWGTQPAVHVRIEALGRYHGSHVADYWFVPGAGLVRRLEDGALYELERLELPAERPGERQAVLDLLAGTDEWAARGSPALVERLERGLEGLPGSGFWLARWPAGPPLLVRARGGRVTRFDPADEAHWEALIAEDGLARLDVAGRLRRQRLHTLARAAAVLASWTLVPGTGSFDPPGEPRVEPVEPAGTGGYLEDPWRVTWAVSGRSGHTGRIPAHSCTWFIIVEIDGSWRVRVRAVDGC